MMTRSWTDVLPRNVTALPSYASNWLAGRETCDAGRASWTPEENKRFEDALAKFDGDTAERWEKVAALFPGKTVGNVISHYRELVDDVIEIEAGRVPCHVYYGASSFTLDWEGNYDPDEWKNSYCVGGKRSGGRASVHERKKGTPWTEEEHKLFLLGMKKYGKGDWRNISRNVVITRTPTQVASHAQKYFIRLNSGIKDKRRSSIHDITTDDVAENNKPPSPSSQPSTIITTQSSLATAPTLTDRFSAIVDSDQVGEAASGFNPSSLTNQFVQHQLGITPFGAKLQPQSSLSGRCDKLPPFLDEMFFEYGII